MTRTSLLLCLAAVGIVLPSYGQHIVYRSPAPQSTMVSLHTNIILRCNADIDRGTVRTSLLEVNGTSSGRHQGVFTLSDDEQTMLFTPDRPLEPGEEVRVALHEGVITTDGTPVEPGEFSFTTTKLRVPLTETYYVDEQGELQYINRQAIPRVPLPVETSSVLDSLPADFPTFKVDTTNNPAPGYYFLATQTAAAGKGNFIFLLDNNGKVVRYKRTPDVATDFKQQSNGYFSYAEGYSPWVYAGGERVVHHVVDTTLVPVDSFRCGNGYEADGHEFLMLPNGHVLLHAYDIQYLDLSGVVTGGNPNAIVVGSILQELDLTKNVVFQWRSWDYVPISDTYNNVASAGFDYIHVNAYDLDSDGNILACFRVTCQILKINRMTGEVMWRMGGRRNQFTFIGENPANAGNYFTFPHYLRRLANGNFLLFDNGNLHPTPVSRAVEYAVDQVNKTATLVWEYRHTPDIFGPQMGSAQRLPNGNTVIGWGNAAGLGVGAQAFTEVRPDKSIAFEMRFLDGTISYRTPKYVPAAPATALASVNAFDVQPGNTYAFNRGDSVVTGVSMYVLQGSSGYNRVSVKRYGSAPVRPAFAGLPPFVEPRKWVISDIQFTGFVVDVTFDSTALASYANRKNAVVYARDAEGTGTFAPLASTYDSLQQTLTVTVSKFGEYIIGVPESVSAPPIPVLSLPAQDTKVNQSLPILLRWLPAGHLTGSHLQLATDSLFGAPLIDDSTMRSSAILWGGSVLGGSYFWRASVRNEQGTSGWSSVGRFSTAAPYITLTNPQPGDKFAPGATASIRWDSNLKDVGTIVSIRLYRNSVFASKINDSTANTGRYQWKLGASLATDSTYTVRVRLLNDTTLFSVSGVFTISPASGVDQDDQVPLTYALEQNYPNPFNPSTTIGYTVAGTGNRHEATGSSWVRLAVYDLLGREVALLVDENKSPGIYEVKFDATGLSSGVYFYRMNAGGPSQSDGHGLSAESGQSFVQTRRLLVLK